MPSKCSYGSCVNPPNIFYFLKVVLYKRIGLSYAMVAFLWFGRNKKLDIGFCLLNSAFAFCICKVFEKALAPQKDQFIQFPVTRKDIQYSIDEFEEK